MAKARPNNTRNDRDVSNTHQPPAQGRSVTMASERGPDLPREETQPQLLPATVAAAAAATSPSVMRSSRPAHDGNFWYMNDTEKEEMKIELNWDGDGEAPTLMPVALQDQTTKKSAAIKISEEEEIPLPDAHVAMLHEANDAFGKRKYEKMDADLKKSTEASFDAIPPMMPPVLKPRIDDMCDDEKDTKKKPDVEVADSVAVATALDNRGERNASPDNRGQPSSRIISIPRASDQPNREQLQTLPIPLSSQGRGSPTRVPQIAAGSFNQRRNQHPVQSQQQQEGVTTPPPNDEENLMTPPTLEATLVQSAEATLIDQNNVPNNDESRLVYVATQAPDAPAPEVKKPKSYKHYIILMALASVVFGAMAGIIGIFISSGVTVTTNPKITKLNDPISPGNPPTNGPTTGTLNSTEAPFPNTNTDIRTPPTNGPAPDTLVSTPAPIPNTTNAIALSSLPSFVPSRRPSKSQVPTFKQSEYPSSSTTPSGRPSLNPRSSGLPSFAASYKPSISTRPSLKTSNRPSDSAHPAGLPSWNPSRSVGPSLAQWQVIQLKVGRTFSKEGNRWACAWDRCPSSNFYWVPDGEEEECTCIGGLRSCHFDGDATTVVSFNQARITPVDLLSTMYKLEAVEEDALLLKLGEGKDTASGSTCFDDPLRGGFDIDLTGTGYVFAEGSTVTLWGWAANMRMSLDGEEILTTNINDAHAVPSGGRLLQVNCGGWGGGCSSDIFVTPSLPSEVIQLQVGGTFSKEGNRRACAWDRCPSSNFYWVPDGEKEECICIGGLRSCHFDGDATTVVAFNQARITPVDLSSTKYKLEAVEEDALLLKLGEGKDTASGSTCFDDPLRGGFDIDLTGTGYVFAEGSTVTLWGWAANMRLSLDGEEILTTNVNDAHAVPSGGRLLQVNCGGWGGGCSSDIYVTAASTTIEAVSHLRTRTHERGFG